MENATAVLTDYLFQVPNLLIVASTWTILSVTHRVFPRVKAHSLWARLSPVAPIALCSAMVWIPGAGPDGLGVGSRIMLGIVLGAMAANAHKILRQSALGHDDRIRARRG